MTSAPVALIASGRVEPGDANGARRADGEGRGPGGLAAVRSASSPRRTARCVSTSRRLRRAGRPGRPYRPVALERFAGPDTCRRRRQQCADARSTALSRFISVPVGAHRQPIPRRSRRRRRCCLDSGTGRARGRRRQPRISRPQPTPPLVLAARFRGSSRRATSRSSPAASISSSSSTSRLAAVGVRCPVVVEEFDGLSLETAAAKIAAASTWWRTRSFWGQPTPILSAPSSCRPTPTRRAAGAHVARRLVQRVAELERPRPICSRAGPATRTSSSRSRPTAPRSCASATTQRRGAGSGDASPPPTASATAPPAMSARTAS